MATGSAGVQCNPGFLPFNREMGLHYGPTRSSLYEM
jgi:hypothetical protein